METPPGAWHVMEAVWGGRQKVRLATGPPSLVEEEERVRSMHAVGFLEDRVLLVRNRDGTWTFPGGRREERETCEEALRREVWEEARAVLAPGYRPVAVTRIEFLNRVPGRVFRVHPSYLLWVVGSIHALSDEPHHDPADYVEARHLATVAEAKALLGPLESTVLGAAVSAWGDGG